MLAAYFIGAIALVVLGIGFFKGKLTSLLAGITNLTGNEQKRAVRDAENLGIHKAAGALCLLAAVCLVGTALLPDARWPFGGIVLVGILALLAFANRDAIRQYLVIRKRASR